MFGRKAVELVCLVREECKPDKSVFLVVYVNTMRFLKIMIMIIIFAIFLSLYILIIVYPTYPMLVSLK